MATMNVSLPDEMKEWVDQQVANGRFANASDAVRDFIRRDQVAVARFQAVIDEARASRQVIDLTETWRQFDSYGLS